MASSVTTLALTLILIFHLTPETTATRRLNDQKPTDEVKNLPFPPGLPFGGVPPFPGNVPGLPFPPGLLFGDVPPLPSIFPPFPGDVPLPRLPFPFPLPSSPPASIPGLPDFKVPPVPFLTPPPP